MSPRLRTAGLTREGWVGAALTTILAVGLGPTRGVAQAPRFEVDLSGSRIEYDTLPALGAPSISTLLEWQRPSLFGRVTASATGFEDSGWSVQGRGDLARWFAPGGPLNRLRLEIAGTAAGSRHSAGFNSLLARGDARVHVLGRRMGAWAGTSLASAKNSFDSASVTGVVPSAGVWTQTGPLRATLSYLHTTISGDSYPESNLAVTYSRGPIDLTVYGGLRGLPSTLAGSNESWAGASTALWVGDRAAIVISGGQYSSDLLQGLPGGEFISVGVRLTPRRVRPIPISARAPIVYTREAARAGSISFAVQDATAVEIAGDWNEWQPVPLSTDISGRWLVPAGLAPGVYRFNLRVDGERWIVPEGVPVIDDGYGGTVGILIISNQQQ